nr:hypothetical protein [Tanacetum cinerariifolium]GEY23850.1 hypothetical protein [Tanacetum cinerariifolium]
MQGNNYEEKEEKPPAAVHKFVGRGGNSFEALNVDYLIIKEVATGSKVTTTEDKLVLVDDDDGKPLEKVDYPDNSDSDDEVEHVKNETASFLASWIWFKKPVRTMEGYISGCIRFVCGGIERGFLSQKVSGGGRGVKEKSLNRNSMNTSSDGVTPSMVDMMVEKEKISSLEDTTSSYANITGKPSGKKVNVRTLFTPGGNGIDVVVPVDSIRAISERFANIAYGFFMGKKVAYPVVANYVRNTWGEYDLILSMFSSSIGLFSFQFSFMDGLDAMLEKCSWFIRNNL